MKIAIFTDSFFPGVGGTEKASLGLANALIKEGNEVFLGCPNYNLVKNYEDNFDFKVGRAKSISFSSQNNLALPSISKDFINQLKAFNPDIIHCQSISGMTSFATKYGKANNVPVCITVHTKFKTAFRNSIKSSFIVNRLIKSLVKNLNNCNQVFTVSTDMLPELKSYGYNGNPIVVRNGAMFNVPKNLEQKKCLALKEFCLENEENIFLFVGLIVKYKNIQMILDSLSIVKNNGYKFKMLFVGGGTSPTSFAKLLKWA